MSMPGVDPLRGGGIGPDPLDFSKIGFGVGGRGTRERESNQAEYRELSDERVWNLDAPTQEVGPRIVHETLRFALEHDATDVRFRAERDGEGLTIRMRIDGDMQTVGSIPEEYRAPVIAFIRHNSTIDVGADFELESGRASIKFRGREYDLRLEKNYSVKGQEMSIRILDKHADWNIATLGFSPENLAKIRALITQPYGMVLVTGPTSSGKTTTLYAVLKELAKSGKKNILTAEDPVEYEIPGASQANVNDEQGRSFERLLRSFLRQNPDVIMVGEMRDKTVSEVAAQAAETGHLVFSTLHTNDAVGAVVRLLDMGLRIDNLLASLSGVVAQRLVKRVNPQTWEFQEGVAKDVIGPVWTEAGLPPEQKVRVAVRPKPGVSGKALWAGRLAVQEVLMVSRDIQTMIRDGKIELEIKDKAREEGMITMWQDGLQKVASGLISLDSLREKVKPDV